MLSSSRDALIKTTSPKKTFPSDCITLYLMNIQLLDLIFELKTLQSQSSNLHYIYGTLKKFNELYWSGS